MRYRHLRIISVVFFFTLVVFGFTALFGLLRLGSYIKATTGITPISIVALLLDGESIINSTDGHINVLLLGIGGGDHEGGDLTDSMIIASFNTQKKSLALISIPRDLWSETLKDKINSAYHYGEQKKKGGGIALSKAIVEDVIGIPIHYSVVYDFSQFATFIDAIGGVDVEIEQSFTDTMYPISGKEEDLCGGDPTYACRYETVTFIKGVEHMNGARVLVYVRSRHSEGDEGSDFARSRRQQEVLQAIKQKLPALKLFFHPKLALTLFALIDKATDSDMTIAQDIALGKLVMRMNDAPIQKISIEPYLEEAPQWKYERYVLEPNVDYDQIHAFIEEELSK